MKKPKRTLKREYRSLKRDAQRDATRQAIVKAAARLLREPGPEKFSLDAVARAAEVTRVTVYNQFGDRRGLLESVFDAEAVRGGLVAIPEAMQLPDPEAALARVVRIFCAFWSQSKSMQGVNAAAMVDAELGEAIRMRNERRRRLLEKLVKRMKPRAKNRAELTDALFALTSFAFHAELSRSRLSQKGVERVILSLAGATVGRRIR